MALSGWEKGSLRVGAHLGVGCGPGTSFFTDYVHPSMVCVESTNATDWYGGELWAPLATVTHDVAALRLTTEDTVNPSHVNYGLVVYSTNGGGGADSIYATTDTSSSSVYVLRLQSNGSDPSTASDRFRVMADGTVAAPSLPGSAGAGGVYVCVDSTGVFYKKASCP